MLAFFAMIFGWLFTTGEERQLARDMYTNLKQVVYKSERGYYGAPLACRFFIETDHIRRVVKDQETGRAVWGTATLRSFHFEGWFLGLGYEDMFYWGRLDGRFRFFFVTHRRKHDPDNDVIEDIPIQRGVEP